MQVWNLLRAVRWKYRTQKNRQKLAIWAPSHNILSGSSLSTQRRHASTIGKKLVKRQYLLHMSSQYMANFGPLTMRSVREFGAPQHILTGFATCLRYCSDVAHRRPTKLCTMYGRLLGWYTIYTFSGALARTEFCPVQYSLYVQVLRSPVLAALLHSNPAAGVSQTLRRGTRNGITELSQRAPPIFGQAAITLGIDPHCSCSSVLCTFRKQKMTVLADSKVSDVKVTWWFWNKRTSMSLYVSLYTSALEVEGMLKRLQLRLGWVTAI